MSGAIRVAALAVFRRGDEVLVFDGFDSVKGSAYARPPGGGVEFGEYAEAAVRREVREELGVDLASTRHLGVIENVFAMEGVRGHQVMFIYEAVAEDPAFLGRDEMWGEDLVAGVMTPFRLRWLKLGNDPARLVPEGLEALLRSAWGLDG